MKYISESDVYRLITHSKLPSAEKFENWVFEEVLPSIRKTGGYVANGRYVYKYLSAIR
jgi:prophage antirepressor-like protein